MRTISDSDNLFRGYFLSPCPDNIRCGQKQIRTVTVPTDCECSWFTSQSKVVLWTSRIKSDRRVITMTYAATPNYHLGVGWLDHQKIVPLTFFCLALSPASFSPPCLTCNSGSVKIIRFVNDHTFCHREEGLEPTVKRKVVLQKLYFQHYLEALILNTTTNMFNFWT